MSSHEKRSLWKKLAHVYKEDYAMYQDHLQHATQLLILLNISLFFLTQLVTKQGYYYTFFSLILLGIVQLALILPVGLMRTLRSYCFFLILEFISIYYFLSSIIYWIITNRG